LSLSKSFQFIFSKAHELHGVDLDIFRPQTSEEYHNFLQFVQEASIAWHAEGIQLSVTCHPHRFKLPRSVFAMVDRVNLMAYDMVTGQMMYHSTLSNTQEAVDSLLTQNCPANKIWLGIPSYGRSLLNPHDAMTFESLHKTIQGKSDYNVDTTYQHDGYEWDSPERIRAKIDYADFQQLGGVFFWELGQDYQDEILAPGGILLEAASSRRRHLLVSKSKDEL
jgi:GH18 family chitinase